MKAKTVVLYSERRDGVGVSVRYWESDSLFTYVLYWERYKPPTECWCSYEKTIDSGAEVLDVDDDDDAAAQRAGIAKFDSLLSAASAEGEAQ